MSRTIGAILRRERERKGLSQEELAHKTGIARSKIAMIETNSNKRYLNTDELFSCADALSISPCYLLTGNDDENRKCAADELGLSNDVITVIQLLDEDQKEALEYIIKDEMFLPTVSGYFTDGGGIYKNGNQIADPNDKIDLGGYGSFGNTYTAFQLVRFVREQTIIRLLRDIREEAKNHEESKR